MGELYLVFWGFFQLCKGPYRGLRVRRDRHLLAVELGDVLMKDEMSVNPFLRDGRQSYHPTTAAVTHDRQRHGCNSHEATVTSCINLPPPLLPSRMIASDTAVTVTRLPLRGRPCKIIGNVTGFVMHHNPFQNYATLNCPNEQ